MSRLKSPRPANGFDLLDPAFIADPYPHYTRLRDEDPVHHSIDTRLWIVTRHADVESVLRDSVRFSSDLGQLARGMRVNPFNPAMKVPPRVGALALRIPWLRVLLTSDPPAHTVLRRKVSRAFTPRVMAAWEPRIREITEQLVDDFGTADGSNHVDLVRSLASPLPTAVIAEMMGIPPERRDDFKRWSDNLVGGLVGGGSITRMASSSVGISQFFARIVRQRRRRPGDDLISRLVSGDEDEALNWVELVTFCVLLLVAGNETTTNLIANAMLALFDNSDVQARLEADPAIAAAVIEETLRYDNPGQGLLRVTTTDVAMHDHTIPAGSNVLPMIGSANRDPRRWADPDRFIPERQPNDHLGFGTGIHLCIGAPLARMEGRIALETLFGRTRRISPDGSPTRIASPVLRGLRSLPVSIVR